MYVCTNAMINTSNHMYVCTNAMINTCTDQLLYL